MLLRACRPASVRTMCNSQGTCAALAPYRRGRAVGATGASAAALASGCGFRRKTADAGSVCVWPRAGQQAASQGSVHSSNLFLGGASQNSSGHPALALEQNAWTRMSEGPVLRNHIPVTIPLCWDAWLDAGAGGDCIVGIDLPVARRDYTGSGVHDAIFRHRSPQGRSGFRGASQVQLSALHVVGDSRLR